MGCQDNHDAAYGSHTHTFDAHQDAPMVEDPVPLMDTHPREEQIQNHWKDGGCESWAPRSACPWRVTQDSHRTGCPRFGNALQGYVTQYLFAIAHNAIFFSRFEHDCVMFFVVQGNVGSLRLHCEQSTCRRQCKRISSLYEDPQSLSSHDQLNSSVLKFSATVPVATDTLHNIFAQTPRTHSVGK